jgi:hypothetical protein
MISLKDVDPFNNNKKLNISNNYNLYKYNCSKNLDVILTYTRQYLNSDVIDWLFKKCFKGSKSDYWSIERGERERRERGREGGGERGVCGGGVCGGGGWRTGNSGSGVLVVVVYANSVCDAHRVPWCNSINKEKTKGGESGSGALVAVMYTKNIRDARRVPKTNSTYKKIQGKKRGKKRHLRVGSRFVMCMPIVCVIHIQ